MDYPDPWGTSPEPLSSPLYRGGAVVSGPARGGSRQQEASRLREGLEELRRLRGSAKQELLRPGGMFKTAGGDYRRAMGGKSTALLSAVATAMEDPVAGLISAPVGIAAGAGANALTTALTQGLMQGPPQMKAAGMALRFLAPAMVGTGVQQATARGVQSLTGSGAGSSVTGVQSGEGGGLFGIGTTFQDLKIPVPFLGSIAIGEREKRRRESAFGREERAKDVESELELLRRQNNLALNQEIEAARAISNIQLQSDLNRMKGMAPYLADVQRRELAGQQALLNTQGAIYQRLGRMAGMFQLTERGMAESGATARAMIANSPYNAAILPAPQISFG